MKLFACNCTELHYRLAHRTWWMRIFIGRRRYRCYRCGASMLLSVDTPSQPFRGPDDWQAARSGLAQVGPMPQGA